MSKIAIIIPFYERINLLDKCLYNIVNQTFSDYHIYLVNDGGSDPCFEKFPYSHLLTLNKITYLKHKTNRGPGYARAFALHYISNHEYVMFLDSDDDLENGFLEQQIFTLSMSGKNVGAVISETFVRKNDKLKKEKILNFLI